METEWFIGTIEVEPGKRSSVIDLAVPISEAEHQRLRDAERIIRQALDGLLFRLVFVNYRALKDQETRMLELLTQPDRRGFSWVPEQHVQTTLALANWLTSVRWLLDHTQQRLAHEPDKLEQFKDATSREFDGHFAYRFSYNLRDYATHCDLPPVSMHVESQMVGNDERVDHLSIQLEPTRLLSTWRGWKALVKSDLMARSEPIDLVPLVDEAMACVERVMAAIIGADDRDRRKAAQLIVDAVERLPEDARANGAEPVLFATESEAGNVRRVSPTPLPITQARDMLNAEQRTEAFD